MSSDYTKYSQGRLVVNKAFYKYDTSMFVDASNLFDLYYKSVRNILILVLSIVFCVPFFINLTDLLGPLRFELDELFFEMIVKFSYYALLLYTFCFVGRLARRYAISKIDRLVVNDYVRNV